ncbi:uncharacterized protein LOC115444731 [Manduca sexta]|uniref:uncharacterized protein LOC115444731 n=1 Tax=Manduca sexta TaxID=7130 RepID=UPI00188FB873|nr:uncharacterized protein LOC115444731 [Manduca sexta]
MYLRIIFTLFFTFSMVHGQQGSMIGPGLWNILSFMEYEPRVGDNLYMNCDVVKRRLNRTNEGYNVTCDFEKDLDDSYGILIDICKKVDGGCKPYQILKDENITQFFEKYTNENIKQLLLLAGVDPPEFPLATGSYKVQNYMVDYCNLPPNCPYGEYEGTGCITKHGQRVCCVAAIVEFVEDNNDVCGYE